MYVVTVEITVPAQKFAVFLPLMLKNAEISRTYEPGCRQFDAAIATLVTQRTLRTWERLAP